MTVVNLDPSDGLWTLPGTIGVMSTAALLPTSTPAASFGSSYSSGPPVPFPPPAAPVAGIDAPFVPPVNTDAYAALVDPLVYFVGHNSPNINEPHYELLLKSVAEAARKKVDAEGVESWKSGVMVDTPGEWAEKKGGGWEKVKAAVREFESASDFGFSFFCFPRFRQSRRRVSHVLKVDALFLFFPQSTSFLLSVLSGRTSRCRSS
jgi:polyribonucleotide 5'-hydroxyl-kinase